MKKLIYLIFWGLYTTLFSQPNTEVYLLEYKDNALVNLQNISENEGYDNQPSFYDDHTLLFASTKNNQTDVAKYDIKTQSNFWITQTDIGSEYSPLKIPNQEAISAIRLDTSGLQRLYQIDLATGQAKELLKDLVVGYHVWYDDYIIVHTVLVDNQMDLVISNLKDQTHETVAQNVGRSLHKIPNSNLISFISQEEKGIIKHLNPLTKEMDQIIPLPPKVQDMCWLNDGTILIPDGNKIMRFNPEMDTEWSLFHQFEEEKITEISRMAVSPNSKYFAMVSIPSPTSIIQQQVEAFNRSDLNHFAACFSDDVVVRNYPNDTMYVGNTKLKNSYERFFAKTSDTKVEVVKRIVIGQSVIDEEKVSMNGKTYRQAAIYQVENGKIKSMTFIGPKREDVGAEKAAQRQLEAYNKRDLDAFVDAFAEDIKVYNYPNTLSYEGQEKLRENFKGFFARVTDLHCDIKNRIVIGNIVIDEEYITANGRNFSAVAIYEVENDKVKAMNFVR